MTAPQSEAVLSRRGAWHQSTLETLLDGCSWQYFLTYVLGIESAPKPASVAGVAYHSAIEAYEKARATGDEMTLAEMMVVAETEVRLVLDEDSLVAEAKAAVGHWYGTPSQDGLSHREWLSQYDAVAIEPYFRESLVVGALPVAGWIDGVYRHKETGQVILVDHKTAKNLSRWGHDGDEHRSQATMYSVALVLSDAYDVADLVPMHYLISRKTKGRAKNFEGARHVTVQPILEDVRILGDRIRRAEQIVAEESYTRRPEWGLCSVEWCPHYDGCMTTKDLAGTPAQVRDRLSVTDGSPQYNTESHINNTIGGTSD